MTREDERAEALCDLMALPDPPDIRRGYHHTQPRDPRRNVDHLKRDLGMAYVAHRMQDRGKDISKIESFRRSNVYEIRRRA